MIRSIALVTVLLTTAAPALAQDINVTVRNLSGNNVDRIEAFAVSSLGQRSNRKLGSVRDVPSKASADFAVAANGCGPVRFVVSLFDKSQFEVDMDLCTDQVLMLQQ